MKKIISIVLAIVFLTSLTVSPSFAANNNGNSEDLLKEKSVSSIQLDNQSEIDEAFQRVDNEENYIVSLINTLSKKETNKSNWEYNLKFLKDNYKDIVKKSKGTDINMKYVDSYIEAYEMVLLLNNSPLEKKPTTSVSVSATYDLVKAVDYAKKYYKYYNTAYPDWSYYGDCANFVSLSAYMQVENL